MAISDYSIGGYSIGDYWCLFNYWILMVIQLMVIGGYSMNGY